MLTTHTTNAEWVLWLNPEHVLLALAKGDSLAVKRAVAHTRGMEAVAYTFIYTYTFLIE